jgi:cation:H+ antiporter
MAQWWLAFIACSGIIVVCGTCLSRYGNVSARAAMIRYSLNALAIVAAAMALPFIGDRLAAETGLGEVFSERPLSRCPRRCRRRSCPLPPSKSAQQTWPLPTFWGSNLFNILILAIDDLFYTQGPLLSSVSQNHAMTGFMAVIMTGSFRPFSERNGNRLAMS